MLREISQAEKDKYCIILLSHLSEIPINEAQTQRAQWWSPGTGERAAA